MSPALKSIGCLGSLIFFQGPQLLSDPSSYRFVPTEDWGRHSRPALLVGAVPSSSAPRSGLRAPPRASPGSREVGLPPDLWAEISQLFVKHESLIPPSDAFGRYPRGGLEEKSGAERD